VQKAEELGVDIEAMTNRAGAAEEAYQKMAHTPLGELARLWEAIKKLGRTVGDGIETYVSPPSATGGTGLRRSLRMVRAQVRRTARDPGRLPQRHRRPGAPAHPYRQ